MTDGGVTAIVAPAESVTVNVSDPSKYEGALPVVQAWIATGTVISEPCVDGV